jgi:uncharacterized membrane protein HdeD (DUF308 family)
MSFREISAWLMGLLMVASGIYYLSTYISATNALGGNVPPLTVFVPYTIYIVTGSIFVQTLLAILAPKGASARVDERERPILDRAGNWSGLVQAALTVTALLYFIHYGDGQMLFHMIVGGLIISQIIEYGLQILMLRQSA